MLLLNRLRDSVMKTQEFRKNVKDVHCQQKAKANVKRLPYPIVSMSTISKYPSEHVAKQSKFVVQ